MKSGAGELDLLQDVAGFGGPDEGFGVVVVMVDVVEDRCYQFLDTAKHSAPQSIYVRSRKKRSTMFSHEQPVGVKCM
jgi:hypothetical protein